MTETIELHDYYHVTVKPKMSEVCDVLAVLKAEGVDLIALATFPEGRHLQLDFVPKDGKKLERIAKARKWALAGPKKVFVAEAGEDHPGKAGEVFATLAEHGIEVTALTSLGCDGCCHELFWVPPRQVKKALAVLEAAAKEHAAPPEPLLEPTQPSLID